MDSTTQQNPRNRNSRTPHPRRVLPCRRLCRPPVPPSWGRPIDPGPPSKAATAPGGHRLHGATGLFSSIGGTMVSVGFSAQGLYHISGVRFNSGTALLQRLLGGSWAALALSMANVRRWKQNYSGSSSNPQTMPKPCQKKQRYISSYLSETECGVKLCVNQPVSTRADRPRRSAAANAACRGASSSNTSAESWRSLDGILRSLENSTPGI